MEPKNQKKPESAKLLLLGSRQAVVVGKKHSQVGILFPGISWNKLILQDKMLVWFSTAVGVC